MTCVEFVCLIVPWLIFFYCFSKATMQRALRPEPTPPKCALAVEMFDHFCSAGTMKQILALHREICNTLTLKPTKLPDFYPKLKVSHFFWWAYVNTIIWKEPGQKPSAFPPNLLHFPMPTASLPNRVLSFGCRPHLFTQITLKRQWPMSKTLNTSYGRSDNNMRTTTYLYWNLVTHFIELWACDVCNM